MRMRRLSTVVIRRLEKNGQHEDENKNKPVKSEIHPLLIILLPISKLL
jgi:hypothetical protein